MADRAERGAGHLSRGCSRLGEGGQDAASRLRLCTQCSPASVLASEALHHLASRATLSKRLRAATLQLYKDHDPGCMHVRGGSAGHEGRRVTLCQRGARGGAHEATSGDESGSDLGAGRTPRTLTRPRPLARPSSSNLRLTKSVSPRRPCTPALEAPTNNPQPHSPHPHALSSPPARRAPA